MKYTKIYVFTHTDMLQLQYRQPGGQCILQPPGKNKQKMKFVTITKESHKRGLKEDFSWKLLTKKRIIWECVVYSGFREISNTTLFHYIMCQKVQSIHLCIVQINTILTYSIRDGTKLIISLTGNNQLRLLCIQIIGTKSTAPEPHGKVAPSVATVTSVCPSSTFSQLVQSVDSKEM